MALIEIEDCKACRYCEEQRHWTEDSFETAFNYFCIKQDGKRIADYVDWNEKMPDVPKWCPLRPKSPKKNVKKKPTKNKIGKKSLMRGAKKRIV